MRERIRNLAILVFLCLVITMALAGAAMADESRVFDEAGLFSENEEAGFEKRIKDFTGQTGMDMVIVTTDDAFGKDSSRYAEDFYIDGSFGKGKSYSGILFLIDMDNREFYVKTAGAMTRFITDARLENMLDHIEMYMVEGEYAGAADSFISDSDLYYRKGIPSGQYNYDPETGRVSRYLSIRWYEALIALFVALFSAAVPCLNIKRVYAMKGERRQAANYLKAYRGTSCFAFSSQGEDLIDKRVTQSLIPTARSSSGSGRSGGGSSSRSTTHRSSGRTFGGGGRKF